MSLRFLPILLLAACGGDVDLDVPDPAGAQCGDNDPVIDLLRIEDEGPRDFGSGTWPALLIVAESSDVDGDLHFFEMRLWIDDELDGVVSTDDPYIEIFGQMTTTTCETTAVDLTMRIAIIGANQPYDSTDTPYDTTLEWGVVILDEQGRKSNGGETTVLEFRTPMEL